MNAKTTAAAILLLALASVTAQAGPGSQSELREVFSEKGSKSLRLDPMGAVFVESFSGSIRVVGTEGDKVVVETTRAIKAAPGVDIIKVRESLNVLYDSTPAKLTIKSIGMVNNRQISTRIDYTIKVPTTAAVNVIGGIGDAFSVEQVKGRVFVRNVSGRITIDRATGPVIVDSVNADIIVTHHTDPTSGNDLKSTNGHVEIRVPQGSSIRWLASTLKGDIMTAGLPSLAGQVVENAGQKTYRAALNGTTGPLMTATSITGRLYLLPTENPRQFAASVLPEMMGPHQEDLGLDYEQVVSDVLIKKPTARSYFVQKGRQVGNLEMTAHLGANVFFAQVEGSAKIISHGGEVVLGYVGGGCTVESKGGIVNLGDVSGRVQASTAAGDIFVRSARKGGQLTTGGGSIHVFYAGESLTLESGGGDLTVRQAAGGVRARTESGDIVVATDAKPNEAAPVALTTNGGSIVFEVATHRGFEIDAEIDASATGANRIESAFAGLTTVRERSGNRVKIRAKGRVNGGGPLVTLRATDGNITIGRVPENRVVIVQ